MARILLDSRPRRKEECPFNRYCDSQHADCNGGWYEPYVEFDFNKCKMCTVHSYEPPRFC